MKDKGNRNYTKSYIVLNESWKQHPTKKLQYVPLLPISTTIQQKWTRHAGYGENLISDVTLWTVTHRRPRVGHRARIYIYRFYKDTEFNRDDQPIAIDDWCEWRKNVREISSISYADDIAILANAPAQAETLLHTLESAAAGIGFYDNAHKTEYMCFNQTGDISTLGSSSLKLVDKFTYQGSSVSSSEKDIDMQLTKAWTATNSLSVIWKSDLTDKRKQFFPSSDRVDTAIWMHYMDAN